MKCNNLLPVLSGSMSFSILIPPSPMHIEEGSHEHPLPIREAHRNDSYTADQSTSEILKDVIPEIASYPDSESGFQDGHDYLILSQSLKGLGIRMTKLRKSQQKTMIDVLKMRRQYPAMKVKKKKKGA